MKDAGQILSQVADAVRRGSFAEAERLSRSLVEASPGDFLGWFVLGDVLARSNRLGEALAAYETAGRINPGQSAPFSRAAMLRFRAAFGQPPRPRRPALESPRARIQMTGLGSNGRFGNQLLQYAFVRLYAAEHNLVAELPDWIGRDLFDVDDPFPSAQLRHVDEKDFDMLGSLDGRVKDRLSDCNVSGFFCGDTAEWGDRAVPFRALFAPGAKIRPLLERAWSTLNAAGKTIVAIHLRRADFGYGRFWIAPTEWYLAWLRAIWPRLDAPVLYIATDDRTVLAQFAEFAPWDSSRIGVSIPGADFMVDHYVLQHADHVAISNSTFSFTAAMLNRRAVTFMRPHPNRRELVAFEPWSAPVLLDPVLEPSETAEADRMMLERQFRPRDSVVHIGRYCSQWIHLARSVHPEMRIHELDDGASVDEWRRQTRAAQIGHLIIEKFESLASTLAGARETVGHSRVDMVHFHVPAGTTIAVPREFEQHGYKLFALRDGSLSRASDAALIAGPYALIHERLVPLLLKQVTPGLDLPALCRRHGIQARGVLHVGAHEGEELPTYDAMGVRRTMFIEANPIVHARLAVAMRDRRDVITVNRAIDDTIGRATLHLASFDQSSSLLPMGDHRKLYPQIVPAGTVEVEATTLDALIAELNLPADDFNLLAIDVQGAEAKVLRGARDILRHMDAVAVEVNFAELYRGCAQIEEVDELLGSAGFRRVATIAPSHPSWADAFYVRVRTNAAP